MSWTIVNTSTNQKLMETALPSRRAAEEIIAKLGPILSTWHKAIYETDNPTLYRQINEGLVRGDLEGILLPRISIDEYVPSDPDTDNVVLAFFIKGVPEAVEPLKNFCERTIGVLASDYGDSDTIPDTSIIYVEYDRDAMRITDVDVLVKNVCLMANLEPEDFSLTFPNSAKKYPYDPRIVRIYFETRNREANRIAQQQAIIKRTAQLQKEIDDEMQDSGDTSEMLGTREPQQDQQEPQQATESVMREDVMRSSKHPVVWFNARTGEVVDLNDSLSVQGPKNQDYTVFGTENFHALNLFRDYRKFGVKHPGTYRPQDSNLGQGIDMAMLDAAKNGWVRINTAVTRPYLIAATMDDAKKAVAWLYRKMGYEGTNLHVDVWDGKQRVFSRVLRAEEIDQFRKGQKMPESRALVVDRMVESFDLTIEI